MDYLSLIKVLPNLSAAVIITGIGGYVLVTVATIWANHSSAQALSRADDSRARVDELKAINTQVLAVIQQNAEAITKMSGTVEMVAKALDSNTAALAHNITAVQMLIARAA